MNGRLESLDALRGFDMLFISGLSGLVAAVCMMVGAPECWLAEQMRHVAWVGLHHHDTIFPLFLFMAGVSWPFSLAAQRARTQRGRTQRGQSLLTPGESKENANWSRKRAKKTVDGRELGSF